MIKYQEITAAAGVTARLPGWTWSPRCRWSPWSSGLCSSEWSEFLWPTARRVSAGNNNNTTFTERETHHIIIMFESFMVILEAVDLASVASQWNSFSVIYLPPTWAESHWQEPLCFYFSYFSQYKRIFFSFYIWGLAHYTQITQHYTAVYGCTLHYIAVFFII